MKIPQPRALVRWSVGALLFAVVLSLHDTETNSAPEPPKRNFAYRELTGTVEEFSFLRQWRSYYWREDFTLLVRDDSGATHRVISREPTPWNQYRLGTTYTRLAVDWTSKPRVQVIGVQAIDRIPEEFPGLKLDPAKTMTAFIVRVQVGKKLVDPSGFSAFSSVGSGSRRFDMNGLYRVREEPVWRDFYVNNWFHHWGDEADRKVLPHYANNDPNYTVYGYLNGKSVPLDKEGEQLLRKFEPDYSGIIYHGRIVKTRNPTGYALHLLHLLGRHKKSSNYAVYYGDAKQLTELDGKASPEAKKRAK